MIDRLPFSRHNRVERLIPWYVNNTLSEREAQMVSQHVARCARCRQALMEERALSDLVARQPAAFSRAVAPQGQRLPRHKSAGLVPLFWSGSALAAVMIALIVIVPTRPPTTPPGFETLSDRQGTEASCLIKATPADGFETQDLVTAAEGAGLTVTGVSAMDVVTVAPASCDAVPQTVERLRDHRAVGFVDAPQ